MCVSRFECRRLGKPRQCFRPPQHQRGFVPRCRRGWVVTGQGSIASGREGRGGKGGERCNNGHTGQDNGTSETGNGSLASAARLCPLSSSRALVSPRRPACPCLLLLLLAWWPGGLGLLRTCTAPKRKTKTGGPCVQGIFARSDKILRSSCWAAQMKGGMDGRLGGWGLILVGTQRIAAPTV